MTFYHRLGQLPHKRHTQFRQLDGSLYHEELMGIHGFAGAQSLLYHLRPPTAIQRMEAMQSTQIAYEEQGPLRHRHLRSIDAPSGGDAIEARLPMMGNSEVVLYIARPAKAMDYWYKHSAGDDVLFIHEGTGVLESQFGTLRYRPGDYLVIPTGVMWRLLPDAGVEQRHLVIEAFGHIEPPPRYLNNYGQFLEHSPYCERDIRPPDELVTHDEAGEFEVRVKARGHDHPFDLSASSARRDRLGRPSLALRLQHRGLRADHRANPPAAAGPPDLRRTGLRRVLLCAAAVRLPPAGHPRAVQPLQRRLRRGALLRRGQLHVAQRHRTPPRSPFTPTASPMARTPAPTRDRSAKKKPTSWRSWSTPSARSKSPQRRRPWKIWGIR